MSCRDRHHIAVINFRARALIAGVPLSSDSITIGTTRALSVASISDKSINACMAIVRFSPLLSRSRSNINSTASALSAPFSGSLPITMVRFHCTRTYAARNASYNSFLRHA